MDWDDFKYVQAVARTGSVRRAGELLNVHGSTVARHLDNLEQQVGVRLFARTPRGMEMTASGARVIEALDRVAADLDQVERSLKSSGPELSGSVAVAASPLLAAELVVPALGELYLDHPDIEVALRAGRAIDLLERGEAELALWITDDPPDDLVGRPLVTVTSCAYATAGCLEGINRAPGDGRWVGESDAGSPSARVRARHFAHLPHSLGLDDPALEAAAVEAGLGIGLLPCYLGDARPALVRAGGMAPVREGELWLFSRPETRGAARIQAVSAFLQALVGRQRLNIEGHRESREAAS